MKKKEILDYNILDDKNNLTFIKNGITLGKLQKYNDNGIIEKKFLKKLDMNENSVKFLSYLHDEYLSKDEEQYKSEIFIGSVCIPFMYILHPKKMNEYLGSITTSFVIGYLNKFRSGAESAADFVDEKR